MKSTRRVLRSGKAWPVADIHTSEFAAHARRGAALGCSLIRAPISIDGRIAGVVNAANRKDAAPFDEAALCLLQLMSLFLGRALQLGQLGQLRHLRDSRFAKLALLWHPEADPHTARLGYRHPHQAARILAGSVFREMQRAGFGSAQVLTAASELIGQLNRDLQQEH